MARWIITFVVVDRERRGGSGDACRHIKLVHEDLTKLSLAATEAAWMFLVWIFPCKAAARTCRHKRSHGDDLLGR